MLVASIKRHSQRLYKDTDGNKGRARIRRKIREEKGILTSVIEKYNRMVPNTETLCLETILSGETAWPWQLPHSGVRPGSIDPMTAVVQRVKAFAYYSLYKFKWNSFSYIFYLVISSDSINEKVLMISVHH